MFEDLKPNKYLIASDYQEALEKINTLHLDKNQLNIVYYKNGDRVDALLGVPGPIKDSENIVFNSAESVYGAGIIDTAQLEVTVNNIIKKSGSSGTAYAQQINKRLEEYVNTNAEDISLLKNADEDLMQLYKDSSLYWDMKFAATEAVFEKDINIVQAENKRIDDELHQLMVMIGLEDGTVDPSLGEVSTGGVLDQIR